MTSQKKKLVWKFWQNSHLPRISKLWCSLKAVFFLVSFCFVRYLDEFLSDFNAWLYKVSHSTPQALWGIDKKGTFFQFLIFFHFCPQDKENNFFFCKKFDENLQKKLIFHFLTLKSHFLNLRFLHCILRWETEKRVKKRGKKAFFF